ncbi:MAG: YicC family protein [Deltaproteobacteria bacterium]|nr:YicC family protein [Deltaproteobacteria bacterium]MBW2142910.1 YicC family protein [Deltaproteobacteria bacterium]
MIRSMTAYGRGEYRLGDTLFVAEIKSLNHRYRDIVFRIPKKFLVLEKDLKSHISSRFRRGRIEVFIEMQSEGGDIPYDLEVNASLAKSYFEIFNQLAEQFGLDQEIQLDSLLQMKDVVVAKPADVDMERVKHGLQEALIQALDSLEAMRSREGETIEADFQERVALVGRYLDDVEKRAPDLVEEHRNRLKDNLDRMLKDVAMDESRLAQEVALFAEKSDITEEIVRTRSHLGQFREYMSLDDAVGRRLDFLIQEINREVNTIGSKTSDSFVARVVVEMKAELEKLREQVQNVE